MCDSVAIVALLAQQYLDTDGRLKLDPTGQSLIMQRQAALPPKPMISSESLSIRDLQILERQKKIQEHVFNNGFQAVANPFSHYNKSRR